MIRAWHRTRGPGRHVRVASMVIAASILATGLFSGIAPAAEKDKKDEKKATKLKKNQAYVAPDFAARGLKSIAMPAPTAVEKSEDGERLVTQALGAAFSPLGYRMMPPSYVKEQSARAGETARLEVLQKSFLAGTALDTAACQTLGEKLMADAILFTNVTTWQRVKIDPYTRGQSFTQVGGDLALFSLKDGVVLWRGTFQEKMDGPYNEPAAGEATQVDPGGNAARTARLEPPGYPEVLQKLMERAAGTLPKPSAAKPVP